MNRDVWWSLRRSSLLKSALSTLGGGILIGGLVGAFGVAVSAAWSTSPAVQENLAGQAMIGAVFGALLGSLVSLGVVLAGLCAHGFAALTRASTRRQSIAVLSVATLGGLAVCWLFVEGFLGWQVAGIASVGVPIAALWFTCKRREDDA